jgi:chromosome segregation ATPase
MSAIQTGSYCCNWCAPAPLAKQAVKEGLGTRCCPNWRMIPGFLALVATITAVVCAIIWECPYLCIAFAPGSLASGYLIHLGWDFQNLRAFTTNNDLLKTSVSTLQSENAGLQQKLSMFETENKKLQETEKSLTDQTAKLESENKNLGNTISSFEEKVGKHMEQLGTLGNSLQDTETYVREDHQALSKSIDALDGLIGGLRSTLANFQESGSAFDQKMKDQTSILLTSTTLLKDILTELNQWRNESAVLERVTNLQNLNKMMQETSEQRAKAEGCLTALKTQIEGLNTEIAELGKIKDDYKLILTHFTNLVSTTNLGEFKGDVKQLTQVVEQLKRHQEILLQHGIWQT